MKMPPNEAIKMAEAWTKDLEDSSNPQQIPFFNMLDTLLDIITSLLHRNEELCKQVKELQCHINQLTRENEALSLDLGIKNQDFRPTQPHTIADIIKECTDNMKRT